MHTQVCIHNKMISWKLVIGLIIFMLVVLHTEEYVRRREYTKYPRIKSITLSIPTERLKSLKINEDFHCREETECVSVEIECTFGSDADLFLALSNSDIIKLKITPTQSPIYLVKVTLNYDHISMAFYDGIYLYYRIKHEPISNYLIPFWDFFQITPIFE